MQDILKDIENKLNIKIDSNDIHLFSDGTTEARVFSIKEKYLIKCTNKLELDIYKEFLSKYKSKYFQKLYYINYEMNYMCLSYVKGTKFDNNLNIDNLIDTLYNITSNYKIINYDGFGYLFEDHKTWYEFLKDEVDYSISLLEKNNVNIKKVVDSLNNVKEYKNDKYLLHGDFGTHNFIVNTDELYIIDPMGLVGDPIYDFYFSVFSSSDIFTKIDFKSLLNYFDRDIEYKKSIMIITFFIRLCRAYKYDREYYDIYLEYYNNL